MWPRRPSSSGVGRKCFSYPESSGAEAWGASVIGTCSISSTSRMGESPGGWAWDTSWEEKRLRFLPSYPPNSHLLPTVRAFPNPPEGPDKPSFLLTFMWGRLKLLLAGSGTFSQTQWGSTLCRRWTHLASR